MSTNCVTAQPHLGHDAIVERLAAVQVLADVDARGLDLIAAASVPIRASAHTTLVRHHAAGDGLFIVLSGTVDVIDICERVAIVPEGGVVGERAALGRRNATLMAGTDVEVLYISGPAFTALLDAFPDTSRCLQLLIAARTP